MAKEMLGKLLVKASHDGVRGGVIVECEAYLGLDDPASHIGRGFTPRTTGIFGMPGMVYVYFIYGVHHCVNAVTLSRPPYGAVLIRGLEPISKIGKLELAPPLGPTNGPGRLTAALGIDLSDNKGDLTRGPVALLAAGRRRGPLGTAPRVGISRATDLPLRYFLKGNPFVSPPRPEGWNTPPSGERFLSGVA